MQQNLLFSKVRIQALSMLTTKTAANSQTVISPALSDMNDTPESMNIYSFQQFQNLLKDVVSLTINNPCNYLAKLIKATSLRQQVTKVKTAV